MDKKYIKLDDTEIEDHKFQYESSISTNDINKIVAPNKFPFSKQDFKRFIGYKASKKIRPLFIFCPQTIIIKEILINIDVVILLKKEKEKAFIKYAKFRKR